ncbi:fasciclin domain-containing protein [Xylanibacter muris]|uniref:Beta-Ig-H3/fasciclin n=1 Tax=Xylanibacter muris TaxID=2736290 RepID=A0ABX2AK10_9BACT|nr:fasciclin domain-containing protein [Xylanibacter muris]NPD91065.1 beta-Ig-H3/fasciclin [Xylanibacter muris]
MTRNNIINGRTLGAMAVVLGIVACSDKWDEHYNVGTPFEGNLWEAVSSNPNLNNFTRVIEACGYDSSLVSSQMFTVFAPTDDKFTEEDANDIIAAYNEQKAKRVKDNDNTAIKEFVQNHIALYNYSVSGLSNDSIVMMNGKYVPLSSNSFGGSSMSLCKTVGNGVLYTIDEKVKYAPNVFEYLEKDNELDSVAKFLYSFNKYEFQPSLSVPGDIVNGKTEYLDSVTTLENKIFTELKAKLGSEDSTYWMVVPTNGVWNALVPEYEKYFVYDKSVNKRDSLQYTNARMALLRGTTFSRTNNTDLTVNDSAMSTNAVIYELRQLYYGSSEDKYYQYNKPFEPGGIFYDARQQQCSNGVVFKTDNWNIGKTMTFFQTIRAEGENNERLDSVDQASTNAPLSIYKVLSQNKFYNKISGNSYSEISPASGAATNIKAVFNIPSVLSNIGYDIYIVTVPALAGDTLASDAERLPTKFRVRMSYNDENGKQPSKESGWTLLQSSLQTTADEVDTFKVAENVMIPYCSWGENISPQVKIILDTRVSNSDVRNGKFNRILRLDCIIFKPHDEE